MKRFTTFMLLSALLMVACFSYGTDAGPPPQKPDFPSCKTVTVTSEKNQIKTDIAYLGIPGDCTLLYWDRDFLIIPQYNLVPVPKITYVTSADADIGSRMQTLQLAYKNFKPKLSNTAKDFSGYSMIS